MDRLQALLLLLPLLGCCAQAPDFGPSELPLTVVGEGSGHGHATAELETLWLTDEAGLASWLDRRDHGRSEPGPPPAVDFTTSGLLVVLMGEQPTTGYSLELGSGVATVEEGVAAVSLLWNEPPEGAIVGAALTQPYLVLQVPLGDYRSIAILDPEGTERARVEVR